MVTQTEARRDAMMLCIDTFGDRLFDGKRAVWIMVFDSTERDRVCIMQRMPDEVADGLHQIDTDARAVSAVKKNGDKAEMLSFLCKRPEGYMRNTEILGE